MSVVCETKSFFYYSKYPTLSSLYRRTEAEPIHKLGTPIEMPSIQTNTISNYCKENKIELIHYLKLDVEGSEFDVIKGSSDLLKKQNIHYIEFEYGGTYIDSKTKLKDIYEYLCSFGYSIYRTKNNTLLNIMSWSDVYEDYEFSIYIACVPTLKQTLENL